MEGPRALSAADQAKLTQEKAALAQANEIYLREHPEINSLVNGLVKALLEKRPQDPLSFAVEHFGKLTPADVASASTTK
jgi:hypothetical protein